MTENLSVRQFQLSDADAVRALWVEALPDSRPWNEPQRVVCRKQQQRDGLFFVAEQDRRVVGTVIAGYDGIRGWIYALTVSPNHRRRGIGAALLAKAEQALSEKGCPKINLQVRATNAEVVAFYEQNGYVAEERLSMGKPLSEGAGTTSPVPRLSIDDNHHLSQITWDDKPAYLELFNETEAFREYMLTVPYPYTDLDAEIWLSRVMRETLAEDCRNWGIRDSTGMLIGGIGVTGLSSKVPEMGYWLGQCYWSRGIVTSAARTLCDFVFENYDVLKIFARAFGGNPASARVLEKAGFTLEGTLRNHYFRDGKAHDVMYFGLLQPAS